MLIALYAFLPMLLAVPAGRVIDRIGVRRPMLVGSIGVAAGAALPALWPGLPTLYVAATLLGASFMIFQVAAQYATGELSGPDTRAEGYSLLALGYSLSSFAGPLVDRVRHRPLGLPQRVRVAGGVSAASDRRAGRAVASRCRGRRRTATRRRSAAERWRC